MAIRVLIADDHAVVRDGLRLILETDPDIKVAGEASDGRMAVETAKKLAPDVVLMDIAMPGLNGIDALRKIRRDRPSTQAVVLSMYGTLEHIYGALTGGALGYLLKESAASEVIDAVKAAHRGRRYLGRKLDERAVNNYLRKRGATAGRGPLEQLSEREREILPLVISGRSSAEIAEMLSLSRKTVETYRSRMMQKLGVDDLAGLVRFAIEHGLTTP